MSYSFSSFPGFFSDPSLDHVVEDPESFFGVGVGIYPGCLASVELGERAVLDYIKDMASSSSPGPDGLHASIFKNCANVLAKPLSIIFKSMFEENYMPSTLKKAAIVPIHRGGDKLSPSNYRPISLCR